jgi:transcriptional regulator with XRE-family HTH domain
MNIPIIDATATGKNIVRLRKENNLSVKDVQEVFGFSSPQAIYKWQQGNNIPSVDNFVILAHLFNTTIDDILVIKTLKRRTNE